MNRSGVLFAFALAACADKPPPPVPAGCRESAKAVDNSDPHMWCDPGQTVEVVRPNVPANLTATENGDWSSVVICRCPRGAEPKEKP